MTTIADRIAWIIKEEEGEERGNQSAFARKIGASTGLLSIWIKGTSEPGPDYRRAICDAYKINSEWLDTGNGDPYGYIAKSSQNCESELEKAYTELEHARNEIRRLEQIIDAKNETIAALKNTHAQHQDKAAPPHRDDRETPKQALGGT